jgi:hypothetical protein
VTEDAEDVWMTKRGQACSVGGREPAGTSVVGVTPARYGAPASPSELVSMLSGGCEADVWQLIGTSWIPALLEPGASLWSSRVTGSDAAPLRAISPRVATRRSVSGPGA